MSDKLLTITDASLSSEVLECPGWLLVDFWAEWCGPCKALAPLLDELAADYAGELRVGKMNADTNKASMERFDVRGLPTLILFKDGVEKERMVGVHTKTRMAALLDQHLEP